MSVLRGVIKNCIMSQKHLIKLLSLQQYSEVMERSSTVGQHAPQKHHGKKKEVDEKKHDGKLPVKTTDEGNSGLNTNNSVSVLHCHHLFSFCIADGQHADVVTDESLQHCNL